jgi:hypothetical protein
MKDKTRDNIHVATNYARKALHQAQYWTAFGEPDYTCLGWLVHLMHELDNYATLAVEDRAAALKRLEAFLADGPKL